MKKSFFIVLFLAFAPIISGAQEPRTSQTAWWGDRLVKISADDASVCYAFGKIQRGTLFTLQDLQTAGASVKSLRTAQFPYPGQPKVMLTSPSELLIYNWDTKKIEWKRIRNQEEAAAQFHIGTLNLAAVESDNIVVTLADGSRHNVTSDGTRQLVYGQSVHRDEFGIHEGLFWSPSGKLLAFYKMDQSMVTDFPLIDNSTRIATLAPEAYPMAGMTSHKVWVGVYNTETQKVTYLDAGDPTDRYFSNIAWSPDSKSIYMIEIPRSQDHTDLVCYDAATGARKAVLYSEDNPKYINPQHAITFLPWDSSTFIYFTERDGYNHLYLFDTEGHELKQLTKGPFEVLDILGFNAKTHTVIIKSTESSPIRHNTYAVNVDNCSRTLLDGGTGVHYATVSASGLYAADVWSSPSVARRLDVLSCTPSKGKPVITTLENAQETYPAETMPIIELGTIKAADDSTTLYYRMVKPHDFDPTKKYPTVVYVYGGPGLKLVRENRNYSARAWEFIMADKGYIIFALDGRGSAERGFDFESVTFRHLGDVEMQDQMRGVDFLKSLQYVDSERLGVHGWSFGGFMTINLMCTYPDVFKVGVAGGPVIDWKWYEVMYGERYMDTPEENPEGYESTSLINKAGNLKGRLQVIVGYNDPTCVMQHSLSFLRACADAGTQPDYFVYPGQGHNMFGSDRIHLHERITRYFEDYLK